MKNFYLSTSILIASLLTGCIELEEDSSTTLNNDTNISDGLTIPDGVEIGNVACTSDHSVAYLSSDLSNEYTTVLRVSDYTSNTIELIEIEEDIEINFDTKAYLPADFNPYKGMTTISNEFDAIH